MRNKTVLSIDDDDNLQFVLEEYLLEEGCIFLKAGSVGAATEQIESPDIDVILLDLTLPDGEGLSLIPLFKSKTNAGIIVVSGKSDTTEKIVCLEMGADDYITKPFEMRELAARIKAVIRRRGDQAPQDNQTPPANDAASENSEKGDLTFGDGWVLKRDQYQLYNKDGLSADLTTGEFQLLEALALSAHRALSREQLFDLTRDGAYDVYDRAIDIQIARLRKKMGDEGDSPIIKTVRGVGYMFCAEITAQ